MNICAIDPSWTETGIAFTRVKHVHPEMDGPISFVTVMGQRVGSDDERRDDTVNRIARFCEIFDVLLVEEPITHGRQQIGKSNQLFGALMYALKHSGMLDRDVVRVNPTHVKKIAVGKGRGSKHAVLAAAIKRLNFPGHNEHQADARWMLEMALHHYKHDLRTRLPQSHLEFLDRTRWPCQATT